MTISDLSFSIYDWEADQFHAWFDDFVLAGNNDPKSERNGSLEYMIISGGKLVSCFRLDFTGLGMKSLAVEPIKSGDMQFIASADLYMQRLSLSLASK